MQKTIYLHIGTEKTGSTTLQAVSGINRRTLMNHGIFYPRTPGERNHIKLALFAANEPYVSDLRRMARLFPDVHTIFLKQLLPKNYGPRSWPTNVLGYIYPMSTYPPV